jgi:hypothetical protein
VSDWQVVFLGVMAVALVIMAATQIVMSLALLRASREVSQAVRELQRDVKPLVEKATRMADDAARATALALSQIERFDRLVAALSARIEETAGIVRQAMEQPVRQGATIVALFRGVTAAIREWQGRNAAARDDEGPMFVG